jgi:hypothetical protein
MTLSEERLRHMLAHIGPPSADLAVSYRTDELHSILTELLSLRSDAHTNGEVKALEQAIAVAQHEIREAYGHTGSSDCQRHLDSAEYALERALSALGQGDAFQDRVAAAHVFHGREAVGYARSVDVDRSDWPFKGKTSFWCNERQNAYYTVPLFASPTPAGNSLVLNAVEAAERAQKGTDDFAAILKGGQP